MGSSGDADDDMIFAGVWEDHPGHHARHDDAQRKSHYLQPTGFAPADLAAVERFAHWCWDKRFFVDDRDLRFAIGGRMLADIVSDLTAMASEPFDTTERTQESPLEGSEQPAAVAQGNGYVPRFGAYSGHDYTILSLLSALGVQNYPAQVRG